MELNYTENFDILVALISHLGATDKTSRTPTFIARDLSLEKNDVAKVLDGFPAFFRKSKNPSKDDKSKGDHFYTLHLRYSRRKIDKEEDGKSQPLSSEEISMLIGLIANRVDQEQQNNRLKRELEHNYDNLKNSNRYTLIVALIAAAASFLSAILSYEW